MPTAPFNIELCCIFVYKTTALENICWITIWRTLGTRVRKKQCQDSVCTFTFTLLFSFNCDFTRLQTNCPLCYSHSRSMKVCQIYSCTVSSLGHGSHSSYFLLSDWCCVWPISGPGLEFLSGSSGALWFLMSWLWDQFTYSSFSSSLLMLKDVMVTSSHPSLPPAMPVKPHL